MEKRKYRMGQRAEQQRETRERIVNALMELHEELGPAATTVSAVAERAGVQRLTVYRHFPNVQTMLTACTTTWIGLHPPPDIGEIEAKGGPERTKAVLRTLYDYYEETSAMWSSAYRDIDQMPELAEAMAGFEQYLDMLARDLAAAWSPKRSKRLLATIAHALRFSTWQSLSEQAMSPNAMAALVATWIEAAAG